MKITREARKFLEDVLTPLPWWKDALCAQVDPELFYPKKGESNKQGKAVCSRCTVRAVCLQEALERDDQYGIHGGLSEFERRGMKPGVAA